VELLPNAIDVVGVHFAGQRVQNLALR